MAAVVMMFPKIWVRKTAAAYLHAIIEFRPDKEHDRRA